MKFTLALLLVACAVACALAQNIPSGEQGGVRRGALDAAGAEPGKTVQKRGLYGFGFGYPYGGFGYGYPYGGYGFGYPYGLGYGYGYPFFR